MKFSSLIGGSIQFKAQRFIVGQYGGRIGQWLSGLGYAVGTLVQVIYRDGSLFVNAIN